jgi:hypothetical protein
MGDQDRFHSATDPSQSCSCQTEGAFLRNWKTRRRIWPACGRSGIAK